MGRLLFSFMPWWFFALLAFLFGSLSVPFFEDYRAAQTEEFFALNEGPPAVVDVGNFSAARDIGYMDEAHISGRILANLGILRINGEGPDYDAIVLGNADGVPLAVLVFDVLSSERRINQLISTADAESRVAVQGFVTTKRRSEVERELTRRGYSGRNVLLVEPYFENRAGIIAEKVSDAQVGFFVVAGMTVLFAVIAAWRFRRWRKRRAAKKSGRSAKYGQRSPAATLAAKAKALARQPTPWGGTPKPQQKTPKPAVPKTSPPRQPTRAAASVPDVSPEVFPEVSPDVIEAYSTFQSVFPGGGSSFRFKTADQIVREYFGTLTLLSRVNSDD